MKHVFWALFVAVFLATGCLTEQEDTEPEDTSCETPSLWYLDADGDGHGAENIEPIEACDAPEGYVGSGVDCDDNDQYTYPGAPIICGRGWDCITEYPWVGIFGASWFADTGEYQDVTSIFEAGTPDTLVTWTAPGPGRLELCPRDEENASWYAQLDFGAYSIDFKGSLDGGGGEGPLVTSKGDVTFNYIFLGNVSSGSVIELTGGNVFFEGGEIKDNGSVAITAENTSIAMHHHGLWNNAASADAAAIVVGPGATLEGTARFEGNSPADVMAGGQLYHFETGNFATVNCTDVGCD